MTKLIAVKIAIGSKWFYVGEELVESVCGKYDNVGQAKLFTSISEMQSYLSDKFEKETIFKIEEVWKL